MGGEVTRSYDAAHINAVINHPDVFPWVAGPNDVTLDVTEWLSDPAHILLTNEHGGFLFHPRGGGTYEVHSQIVPEGRKQSLSAAQSAARYMFTQTDCVRIVTYVPENNRRAKALTLAMNFAHTHAGDPWVTHAGESVPVQWYELTKDRWMQCQSQQ